MELMPKFDVRRPASLAEAVAMWAEDDNARYVAGGTDMIVNVRRGIEAPSTLVDLCGVAEMQAVNADGDGLHIGGAVTLDAVASNASIQRDYPAVAEAAVAVAGPTHRAYGTIGGNLCLDTRCYFYNQSEWWRRSNDYCLKKGGDTCHVAPSGQRCFAAFSGDVAPALLVCGAAVDVAGSDGTRRVPLADIYDAKGDGRNHLALADGEIVAVIHLPKTNAGVPSGYEKARVRGAIDFPLAGVAVALTMKDGVVGTLQVALTATNVWPHLVKGTDALVGKPLDDDALEALRELVRSRAKPMHTTTVAPWYRRRVAGNLARRLAARLAG